jgi:phage recombination protein Bet
MFLYVCKRTGLDPLTRQIYAVFRWDSRVGKEVMGIQTGIDGMRLIAQRTGEYAGQDDIKYVPEDESAPYPTKATCTVYRIVKGQRVAFTATARWSEYAQYDSKGKLLAMWQKMPYSQLGKCAESLAIRKACPNELSGIYTTEEMGQAENVLADLPKPTTQEKITVLHGAPAEIKKDIAIGSPEAAVQSPPTPKIDTTEVSQKLSEMRERMKKVAEDKKSQESKIEQQK